MKHPLDMTDEELLSHPIIRKVIAKRNVQIFMPDIVHRKGWYAMTFIINSNLLSCNSLFTFEAIQDIPYLEKLVNERVEQYKANEIIDLRIDREN